MRFIKLHKDGKDVWVNIDNINTVSETFRNYNCVINFVGSEENYQYFDEDVNEVIKKIKQISK